MWNWLRQAAGAVGNLFNQGSRYVGNAYNQVNRQRQQWEQQVRQGVPQVQRQVQQQVQQVQRQIPKPPPVPQVDFSAVIQNLQRLRQQPQVNKFIQASNPANQLNAFGKSAGLLGQKVNQFNDNMVTRQYSINQQQLNDIRKQPLVNQVKFAFNRPVQLNKENPAQAIMNSPLNPTNALFQSFNKAPVNLPKPDLTGIVDNVSNQYQRTALSKTPYLGAAAGFAGQNIVNPIAKSFARYGDVQTGQERYQPGKKGVAQLGTDVFNIGSAVYTPIGAGKLTQGGSIARRAALPAFGRGALAGGGISALNQYSDTGQIDLKNVALSALLGGAGNTLLPVAFGGLGRTGTKALANVRKPDLNARITVPSLAEKGRLLQQGYKNVEVVVPSNQAQLPVGTRIADTAPKNPLDDLLKEARKYKSAEELARKPDAQVPVKANRGLIESVKESPMTKASLRNALESEQYTVLPNKVTMDQAVKTINKNPQAALNEVLSTKPRTAQLNAQGLILAEKAQKRGDFETAQKIFQAMAPGNTKEGQAIQILSVWSKTKPEGVVKYAQKVVDDANNTLIVVGKNPSITLSAEKAAGFRKQAEAIAKMPEGKDKLIATQKMLNEIHQQIPASIAEKAQSVLYYAQLLNPKTAVRNIIGNTGFALGETAKDIVGAPIDATLTGVRRLLGQDAQRSIYLPNPVKQIRAGFRGGAEAAKEARVGVNLSGLEGQLQIGNKQPAFRNPVGRGLDKAMQFELSVPDRTFYTSRYQQTLDNLMKGAKVSKPTKEMLDIADYDAKYATFQDDSLAAKAFMNIKKGLNLNKDFGVGSFVINYPKTPGNLLARGIDYSPAGFVKSTLEIAKPLFRQGPFNQKKFIDSFSRALVGTGGLIGTGALLHKAGIITGAPSKDKDVNAQDKATGLGAYRINVDALKRFVTSGFKPQKLEDGDTTISYDWFQPAAIGISMGANIDETQASDKGAVGKLVKMLGTGGASLAAGAETLTQQPLVQGLTKLTGQGGGVTQGVLAVLQGVPASFVPTIVNQVNQLTDNTSRSTYDPNVAVQAVNMVKAKIPGLAKTLQPQVNPEGQNNERYQNGSNNLFNVLLNPAFVGKYNADDVQKEITRLENTTGQTSQYPAIIKNTQKVNGQDVQLNPQQVTDMQRMQGRLTKEAYAKIMSDPAYARLSDTDKVKKLQNIITQANQIARSQVLGDDNGTDRITVNAEGKKPKASKPPKAKVAKKGKTTKAKKGRKGRVAKVAKAPSIRLSAPRKVAVAKVAKLRAPKVSYPKLVKSSKIVKIKA